MPLRAHYKRPLVQRRLFIKGALLSSLIHSAPPPARIAGEESAKSNVFSPDVRSPKNASSPKPPFCLRKTYRYRVQPFANATAHRIRHSHTNPFCRRNSNVRRRLFFQRFLLFLLEQL